MTNSNEEQAAIGSGALDQIFREARTHSKWLSTDVSDETLRRLVDIVKLGPTALNSLPARFLFIKSQEAKERLMPHLSSGNRAKTMAAPVTAVICHDLRFHDQLPKLFPHMDARALFEGDEEKIFENAFRNASMQGGYFITAARALGLDCGPMSGFSNDGVDGEFFKGTSLRSNFLCNLGYADKSEMRPRGPRLNFDEMAKIV